MAESLGDKLSQEACEDVADRILEAMATRRGSMLAAGMGKGLASFGSNISKMLAKRAVKRFLDVVTQTHDEFSLTSLATGLKAFGKGLPPEFTEVSFFQILEVMAQVQDSRQLDVLARGLLTVGVALPPTGTDRGAHRILEILSQMKNFKPLEVAVGLGALGKHLHGEMTDYSLRILLGHLRPLDEPPCAAAKLLIRDERSNLETFLELLKWPTCSPEDRVALIQQIAQVTGESFEGEWALIQWAKAEGYDTDSPPRDPEALESVLEEFTRQKVR